VLLAFLALQDLDVIAGGGQLCYRGLGLLRIGENGNDGVIEVMDLGQLLTF
jgi:hypothetical protein